MDVGQTWTEGFELGTWGVEMGQEHGAREGRAEVRDVVLRKTNGAGAAGGRLWRWEV
jgi:hypothetical protein